MNKKCLSGILAALLVATTAAGCSSSTSSSSSSSAASTTAPAAATTAAPAGSSSAAPEGDAAPAATSSPGSVTYPLDIEQDGVIKYWKPISGDLIRKEGVSADNQTEWVKGLMERTGLELDFINPAVGQEQEQFNLLLASGDLPDIIEKAWLNDYPSGPDDAIKKKLVYDMTDTIQEWAPDFYDYIKNNGDLDKKFKTDAGRYWCFGFIRENARLCIWRGPVVRSDLVKKFGLEMPETIDDWTNMLTVFKENGVEFPFSVNDIGNFLDDGPFCAWGAMPGIYQVDGKCVYGPIQDGFKPVLQLMRGWYADGLLDKNFATNTGTELNNLMGGGRAGATIGNTGGGIGAWTPVVKEVDPNATLEAAKYPVLNKGDTPQFGQKEQDFYQNYICGTISPKSKNLEACVKLLNYGYTEEGDLYMNYGQEGKSFDMIDGYPTMKPEIAKAPDNKAEWSYWARSPYNGIMVQRQEYLEQLLVLPEQVAALDIWANDRDKTLLPPITQSVDEGAEYSRIYTSILDYYKEFAVKYIMGQVPEDAFENEFVPTIKSMNIDRALELRQAALDRYNAR